MFDFYEQRQARYDAEAAKGLHDGECEQGERFYLCHCSKRRREAAGFTEPPGDLQWPPPYCPHCYSECDFDGDGWACPECPVAWPSNGIGAEFTDDYGPDLKADAARMAERAALPAAPPVTSKRVKTETPKGDVL